MINKSLANERKLGEETIESIEILQEEVRKLEYLCNNSISTDRMRSLSKVWTDLNYALQGLWGFSRSKRFHRFWLLSSCTCPKIDNEERWPSGFYVINSSCPLHGVQNEEGMG